MISKSQVTYSKDDNGDEGLSNLSANAYLMDLAINRRTVMRIGLAGLITNLFSSPAFSNANGQSSESKRRLNINAIENSAGLKDVTSDLVIPPFDFKAPPVSSKDAVVVPGEYQVQVLCPWGTPILGEMPAFSPNNSAEDQAQQVGMHHDGMHFFSINGSSTDGLLVINHEYCEPRFLHGGWKGQRLDRNQVVLKDGLRSREEVLKEMNAHGLSIFRINRGPDGQWSVVADARNRRLTVRTTMHISGPAKGHSKLVTKFSPKGDRTRGTLSNCAHGVTPWNTYLIAEENWATYFLNASKDFPREHKRYGVRQQRTRYFWEKVSPQEDEFARFDCGPRAEKADGDYRNEANYFGWIVEVDPFNPESTPIKRTALGRFAHEGVVFQPPIPGQPIVCYSGDDSVFEYIYKFVSRDAYNPSTAGGHLLDHGTLFVAKFNEDFTGEWLPLEFGKNGLTPENGFTDQGDVLINTRSAADFVGATKMDRPEWGAVDPKTRAVYFTLTNNEKREAAQINGPNPRQNNLWGQIVRWYEAEGKPSATRFSWSLFAIGGDSELGKDSRGEALSNDNLFACPDGLWFDPSRRLWIQTDMAESDLNSGRLKKFGNNQMLVANPDTGEIKRFLTGPVGQEITGVVMTPDQKTMFVNVQHPGSTTSPQNFARGRFSSNWPEGGRAVPRSATLVITKKDGSKI